MPSINGTEKDPEIDAILEDLRDKISKIAGVTLIGNRLTIRWNMGKELVHVHMIIEEVHTPTESREASEKYERYQRLFEKCKGKKPPRDLQAELWYAEYGEWPK